MNFILNCRRVFCSSQIKRLSINFNFAHASNLLSSCNSNKLVSQTACSSSAKLSESSPENLIFSEKDANNQKARNISRAMLYFIEKQTDKEKIIKSKTEEFEIGKRHLAKMMGENADSFTQQDIDKAVAYLLPSGLFDKRARPFLKHPKEYYPKSSIAAFDEHGRPLHHLFYTGNSEFYQLIYELTWKLIELKKFEDTLNLVKKRINNDSKDSSNTINLSGTAWISRLELAKKLNTEVNEFNYTKFLVLLKKLANHPYAKREENFIRNYIVPFESPIKLNEVSSLQVDKDKSFQTSQAFQRTAAVKLKIYEGTGQVKINSPEGIFDITYFEQIKHREQLLFPFKVVDRINKFDMEFEFNKGGMSCLAKASRYAISKALCSFLPVDSIEKLRLAGLLTHDERNKERKKPGKAGARKRYTWKSR